MMPRTQASTRMVTMMITIDNGESNLNPPSSVVFVFSSDFVTSADSFKSSEFDDDNVSCNNGGVGFPDQSQVLVDEHVPLKIHSEFVLHENIHFFSKNS